jgi:hypothetical protein
MFFWRPGITFPHLGTGRARGLLVMLASLVVGCSRSAPEPRGGEESAAPAWFVDVTAEVGLDFVHDAGRVGHFFMPQIMGSGAALFDFDNDGRLDTYLVQSGGPDSRSTNRLFRQDSKGRFSDVSKGSGLDFAGYGTGVAVGDVNNDGRPDVFVAEYGRIRLCINNGDGTFTDVSREAGLDSVLWGASACFVDYDRDGWLDLVVVNYASRYGLEEERSVIGAWRHILASQEETQAFSGLSAT